jgi:two-component sensor histidine kinase
VTYLNKIAAAFGNITGGITGKNIWNIFPLKGTQQEKAMKESIRTLQPLQIRQKDPETDIDYEINIYPSKEGLSIYSKNVSDLVKKELQLRKTISQKEMLIKEVHHRVKNNFQLISSIIRLSTFHITNDEIRRMVNDIESRIKVLSLIHEQLYKGAEGSQVNMKIYISNLISQLSGITNHNSTSLTYDISIGNIELSIDPAISVGLIINELFSNSIKHGFKNKSEGKITIEMNYIKNNLLNLIYQDNGSGIEKEKSIHESDSMGFTIIKTIVEQSEGEINFSSDDQGLRYDITLNTEELRGPES